MYLTGAKAEAFVRKPAPDVAAALVFGPDRGLVRERMAQIGRAIAGDTADPFRAVEIAAATLKSDPARLFDEAASLAFGGGRRLVIVREAGDGAAPLFVRFLAELDSPGGAAFVLVEGGDLPKRSSLRAAFETAKKAAAIACYPDDERGLRALVGEILRANGLAADSDALDLLAARLGPDRDLVRGELVKLVLYCDGKSVGADDVLAVVGDGAEASLEAVAFAAADGDYALLDRALVRAIGDGAAPIGLLRAALRHVGRLHLARAHMAEGLDAKSAMERLRPPVFFKFAERFRRQLAAWNDARLATALDQLIEAEIACKATGAPDEMLAHRALANVARAVRK
ncbi:MAG: DNA polymerase III subunit delta [Rhodospirillales bacterium]|nr:DNA polymerase III subunit delta [Rhodospirillales bacterium]MSP80753.1 DNA polymerase III subunit delta [Rhodospirillales bacterium]